MIMYYYLFVCLGSVFTFKRFLHFILNFRTYKGSLVASLLPCSWICMFGFVLPLSICITQGSTDSWGSRIHGTQFSTLHRQASKIHRLATVSQSLHGLLLSARSGSEDWHYSTLYITVGNPAFTQEGDQRRDFRTET